MWEADESPNIQVAAGDGMLDHVRALVEEKGVNGKAGGTAGWCVSFPAAHLVAPCAPGSYVGVVMAFVLDITACALVYRLMLASAPPSSPPRSVAGIGCRGVFKICRWGCRAGLVALHTACMAGPPRRHIFQVADVA